MTLEQIRALFDSEIRQRAQYSDGRRESASGVSRFVGKEDGTIMYAHFSAEEADEVIRREVAYFAGLGLELEWKHYDYDSPSTLAERLLAHGFAPDPDPGTFLILDLKECPDLLALPVPPEIRRITSPDQSGDAIDVLQAVWNEDFAFLRERHRRDLAENPAFFSLYVAYVEGRPVSTAWTCFQPHSQFGEMFGGSTLEAYRGRGFYRGLLAVRAQEAQRRGVRFLTVDAGSMSRPILEQNGFQVAGTIHRLKKPAPG